MKRFILSRCESSRHGRSSSNVKRFDVDPPCVRRVKHVDGGTPLPLRLHWRVLRVVKMGGANVNKLAVDLGAPKAIVKKHLRKLAAAGLVARVGERWVAL